MDDLPTAEEIFSAYYECRKTKRNTWNALKFEERLGCALHPRKTHIMPATNGLQFLGFVLRPWSRYIKRETEKNARKSIDGKCRAKELPKTIQATANSYFGILRQANSWRTRERLAALLRSYGHFVPPKLNRMFA